MKESVLLIAKEYREREIILHFKHPLGYVAITVDKKTGYRFRLNQPHFLVAQFPKRSELQPMDYRPAEGQKSFRIEAFACP